MNTPKPTTAIRSFVIVLYGGDFQELAQVRVPVTVAAPFANRLFRELLPEGGRQVEEPWYWLLPHYLDEPALRRADFPLGPTSLTSTRYDPAAEPPPRVVMHPSAFLRYFNVRLADFQTELYQGDYSVDDIFLAGAEWLARRLMEKGRVLPEQGPFYYAVVASRDEVRHASPDLFPPEAYAVEGVFQLPPLEDDRPRTIFRKLPSDPLIERDLASFGSTVTVGRGAVGQGHVVLHAKVLDLLQHHLPLSDAVEDGGYLLGVPYRQPGSPNNEEDSAFRWLVEITDVLPAQGAWGSRALLLFTGDTWSQMARTRDRDFPDKKLIAWFHTHLFPASDEFGLSGLDQDLHRRYLTRPWQVAILINLDASGGREVRCFQRGPEGDLVESTFQVISDGHHSMASLPAAQPDEDTYHDSSRPDQPG